MADYTWSVGSSGTMLIRDTGTYVEFWLKAGSGTYNYGLPWGYTINGVTDNSNSFRFEPGGSWQRLGRWNVTTDQTVTFRLFDSGTNGLGSGETHSVAIDRTSVPPAPTIVTMTPTSTTIYVNVNNNGSGGLPLDASRIGYGLSSTAPTTIKALNPADGTGTITGLLPGRLYYLWGAVHNAKGWSPWSARRTSTTHARPDPPTRPVATQIQQNSAIFTFANGDHNGTSIFKWELGYRRLATDPWTTRPSSRSQLHTGLPGGTLQFAARAANAVGWSDWSAITTVTFVAGAWVMHNGVWRRAIPYVKHNGVWKVATPYVKIAGMWKGTS